MKALMLITLSVLALSARAEDNSDQWVFVKDPGSVECYNGWINPNWTGRFWVYEVKVTYKGKTTAMYLSQRSAFSHVQDPDAENCEKAVAAAALADQGVYININSGRVIPEKGFISLGQNCTVKEK
jgi:hypothetical protein